MVIRIGTSGWSFDHWAGVLYEPGVPVARRLRRYAEEFGTVELNASFYRWPRDTTFAGWRDRLPAGFLMSVKAARGLTHARRLRSPEEWIERFTRCWHKLGDRRGALLVQLHPAQERDDARLDYFLGAVPPWMTVAVELRHPSWDDPQVYQLLERRNAAYVVMTGAGLPCVLKATAKRFTCGCTVPIRPPSTVAPTAPRICGGGPTVALSVGISGTGNRRTPVRAQAASRSEGQAATAPLGCQRVGARRVWGPALHRSR